MIEVHDSNVVTVTGLPRAYESALKEQLSLPDPKYYKAKNMGINTWGMSSHFTYFNRVKDGISFPKGWLTATLRAFDGAGVEYTLTREKVERKRYATEVVNTIELRDYQVDIVKNMEEKGSGIVHMTTGSGKTIVALEYIARSPYTVTFIVKDVTLLHQFAAAAEKFLGIKVAKIGAGKKEIGDITVATIQTLDSDTELCEKLASRTGVLFVDEIQEMVSDKRVAILNKFAPTVQFGLTATPYRSDDDGRTKAIEILFGDIIAYHKGETMKPHVHVYATGAKIPVRAKYNDMVEDMIHNESRNKLIAGIAGGEIYSGNKVLILTKRVLHAEKLYDILKLIGGVYHIERDTKGKSELLEGFRSGEIPFTCIIGTMPLLGTGFDVPQLDRLLIAGEVKSNVLTEQSVGRVLRILEGKEPIIYDFVDEKNGMLKNQYIKSRKKIYKKNGWEITVHPEYLEKWL